MGDSCSPDMQLNGIHIVHEVNVVTPQIRMAASIHKDFAAFIFNCLFYCIISIIIGTICLRDRCSLL